MGGIWSKAGAVKGFKVFTFILCYFIFYIHFIPKGNVGWLGIALGMFDRDGAFLSKRVLIFIFIGCFINGIALLYSLNGGFKISLKYF